MMNKAVRVNITQSFENTVEDSILHLSPYSNEIQVIDKVEALVSFFINKVESNPYLYSRCADLVRFGDVNIREFNRNDFRVLYEVAESNDEIIINVLLLLRQNQSIQKQLIDYCLIHK
ncbi:MAG: type II toxin-antitoxin system RelE/ParE family toxin [Aliivibrio sp.]|uniref:type II toxin-antitoxin system RelE/ParE family toxin n=1 Tax=Aliivibrio sp. TaxID=1872443 RepID=UPI001A553B30|nr:type II toxin-antitoxin system RelE/ParE family toxin [Aliivibrio sp.]